MENMKCREVGRSRVWRRSGKSSEIWCTNDVCGIRRVGGQQRKGSEWWNEEVGRAAAEKRRAFEESLQRRVKPLLPMTDTGTESGCETGSPSFKRNGGPAMGRAIGE